MGLFERKKKNGDYFVDIIKSVTTTEANVTNLVGKVDEHIKGDYERRKVDRAWQSGVDETLLEAVKCTEKARINGIAEDVRTLQSDKKGWGMVWKFVIGAIVIIAGILGIIWKGGKVFG